jgi:hypothetical protein
VLVPALALLMALTGGDPPADPLLAPVPWPGVKFADKFFRPLQERIRDVLTHCRELEGRAPSS